MSERTREPQRAKTLVHTIADDVSRRILYGIYKPGQRIKEAEVAHRLQASRAPVREALRLLEVEGLVVTEPWCGVRVVELSYVEIDDLFQTFSVIFGLVARLAAKNGSIEELQEFRRRVYKLELELDVGSRIDHAFALASDLRTISRSGRAANIMLSVSRQAYMHQRVILNAPLDWHRSAGQVWTAMADAMVDRNLLSVEAHGRDIIERTRVFTLKNIINNESISE